MKKLKLFLLAIFYIFLYFILTIGLYLTFSNHIYNESNLILASVSSIFVDLFILFVFIIIFRNKLIPDYYDFKKTLCTTY